MDKKKWTSYSLKIQLQIIFSLFVIISLVLIGISCIIFQIISGKNTYNNIYDGFLTSSENDMTMIVADGAKLFDEKLNKLTCIFPNIMARNGEDSFRTDNPFNTLESHYNWPNNLNKQYYDQDYNANITLEHSSINIYNRTIYNYKSLQKLQNVINKTSTMDYLFTITFNNTKDFFAGYMATPSQFLRYYPGLINYQNVTKYVMYNNIGDYWYDQVMSESDQVTYTSPYYDNVAKKLMITIGRVMHNPYDKSVIGAFGSDLILTTIENDIKNLTYLGKGRTILFEKETGYIIADSENNISSLITYKNLENPSISDNLWSYLINNNKKLKTSDDYYIVSINLQTSNGKYILVSSINKKYIFETFSAITIQINTMTNNNIYIVVGVFIGSSLLVLLLAFYLTERIAGPLQKLTDKSLQISQNIGEESLTSGVDLNIKKTGVVEIDEITSNFQQSISLLTSKSENPENSYYNNITWTCETSAPVIAYLIEETKIEH